MFRSGEVNLLLTSLSSFVNDFKMGCTVQKCAVHLATTKISFTKNITQDTVRQLWGSEGFVLCIFQIPG